MFLFVFWKKVKTPKRYFGINWPLIWVCFTKQLWIIYQSKNSVTICTFLLSYVVIIRVSWQQKLKIVDLKGQNRSLFINNELGNEKKGLSHVIVIGKRDKIYVVAPLIEDKKTNLLFSWLFICKCICKVCYWNTLFHLFINSGKIKSIY